MTTDLPILILTVGLPRSGKSSWARQQGFPVVNPDSIRLALHGQVYRQEAERFVWAHAHLMVESLFLAGHQVVILDATNIVRRLRTEWESPRWRTLLRVFDTPAEECRRRASINRPDLLPIIDRMASIKEPILPEERLWEKS
jgi:predicted kinase